MSHLLGRVRNWCPGGCRTISLLSVLGEIGEIVITNGSQPRLPFNHRSNKAISIENKPANHRFLLLFLLSLSLFLFLSRYPPTATKDLRHCSRHQMQQRRRTWVISFPVSVNVGYCPQPYPPNTRRRPCYARPKGMHISISDCRIHQPSFPNHCFKVYMISYKIY